MKIQYLSIPDICREGIDNLWRTLPINEQMQALANYMRMSPDELVMKVTEGEEIIEN